MDKKRILIVEDDADLASLMSDRLKSAGFFAEVAVDGEKALEAMKNAPDLILLDILLPKVDGLTVMRRVRGMDGWGSKVPIIIISNLTPDDNKVIHEISTGAPVFYLVKAEHSLEEIVDKIKGVINPQ